MSTSEVSKKLSAGEENKPDSLHKICNVLFEVHLTKDYIMCKISVLINQLCSWLPFSVYCIMAEAADIFEDTGKLGII